MRRTAAATTGAVLIALLQACEDAPSTTGSEAGDRSDARASTPRAAPATSQAHAHPAPGSDTWTIFRGDAALNGVASGHLPEDLSLRWTFEAGGAIVSSPVVADDRVYFGSDDFNVYCVDFDTGEEIWSFRTELIIEAAPLVHDGTVYIGSQDYFFYAIDAESGSLRWKFETMEKVAGSATIATLDDGRELVVFGSHDGRVYALTPETGERAWVFEAQDRVNATPALAGGRIVFGGCDTILYSLDPATGEPSTRLELGGECHIAASAAVADGVAYFGHHANEFLAVDLATQEVVWSYPNPRFGFFGPPAVTSDRVLFGGRDKRLHCVDRASGGPIWTFPTRRKIDAAPVVCGDRVVFGSGDGRLYVVTLAGGELVWSYDIGRSIFCSPAVVDGTILVGANDGRMYAFGAPGSQ